MKSIKFLFGILLIGSVAAFSSCEPVPRETEADIDNNEAVEETSMDDEKQYGADFQKAIAVMHPTEGNNVQGTVTFTKTGDGIRVEADLSGLSEGEHGFHIHEYGDCSAPDGTSAGGHFNPEDKQHGAPADTARHVGDLGNITADANGNATLSMTDNKITFEGEHSIIGRAVVVHQGRDDLTSQPTGDAGARVACGIIGIDED